MPTKTAALSKTKAMADGCKPFAWELWLMEPTSTDRLSVNEARAMRVAEVLNDFQLIQSQIAQSEENLSVDDYNAPGYRLLRQCRAEARAVLATTYQDDGLPPVPGAPAEQHKRHLQR